MKKLKHFDEKKLKKAQEFMLGLMKDDSEEERLEFIEMDNWINQLVDDAIEAEEKKKVNHDE